MMVFQFFIQKWKQSLFCLILISSLSGCFFESIIDDLGVCEECSGSPIASDNGTVFYRGSGIGSGGSIVYLQEIDSSGNMNIIAGSGVSAVTDGTGAAASFKDIHAIVIKTGTPTYLYVADECTVRRVNASNWQVVTIAGASADCSDVNGTGTAARFNLVTGLGLAGNNLYITTKTTVRKMDITTSVVTTFAGTNNTVGYVDAVGTAAQFYHLSGLVLVGTNMYVIDSENKRLRKIDLNTAAVSTVAGDGTNQTLDGVGTSARLGVGIYNKITFDGDDVLFFTDQSSIRKFRISTGQVTTIVGPNPEDKEGQVGVDARVFFPKGIVYSTGGLYTSNCFGISRLK